MYRWTTYLMVTMQGQSVRAKVYELWSCARVYVSHIGSSSLSSSWFFKFVDRLYGSPWDICVCMFTRGCSQSHTPYLFGVLLNSQKLHSGVPVTPKYSRQTGPSFFSCTPAMSWANVWVCYAIGMQKRTSNECFIDETHIAHPLDTFFQSLISESFLNRKMPLPWARPTWLVRWWLSVAKSVSILSRAQTCTHRMI